MCTIRLTTIYPAPSSHRGHPIFYKSLSTHVSLSLPLSASCLGGHDIHDRSSPNRSIRSVQALSFSKLSHTEMETWAMVILALASVYGLVRCIQDVRDYLGTRATPPTRNTKTKQCQGPTTYTGIRNHTKPKYEVLKDREFDAWGETIW